MSSHIRLRGPRSALVAALCLAGVTSGAARGSAGDEPSALVADLRRAAAAGDARALAARGPAAVPILFDILHAERWPLDDGEGAELDLATRRVLLAALEQLRPELGRWMARALERFEDPSLRATALAVLAKVGTAEEVHLAASVASAGVPVGNDGFQVALDRALGRDERTHDELRALWHELHPELRIAAARALGITGGRRAVTLLVELLGREDGPRVTRALLEQARAAAGRLVVAPDGLALDSVRAYLRGGDDGLRALAAACAGALDDTAAVPALIELVDDDAHEVAAAARSALRTLTGLAFRDGERWKSWYRGELAWESRERARVARDLGSGEPAPVASALKELCAHRLDRGRSAREIAQLLVQGEPRYKRLACAALAQLGSRRALPVLVRELESHDDALSTAAWEALHTLTGESLPRDADAWLARFPEVAR